MKCLRNAPIENMSRYRFYWSKRNNRYDSILDLIGVSQKEDTDFVLLLDDYINAIYIPEIFLTTAKLHLNKTFDWRTFHIIVTRIAKINIRFLKFDEIIFCGISMFSISWIATKTIDCGILNFIIFEGPS